MPGKIVEIKTKTLKSGQLLVGQTRNNDKPVDGKIKVYTTVGNFLVKPENLTPIGFWD